MERQHIECGRCSGKGEILSFAHVQGGICFGCWGTGEDLKATLKEMDKDLNLARRQWKALRNAIQATQDEARKAALLVEQDAITEQGKDLAEAVQGIRKYADTVRRAAQDRMKG